MMMHLISLNPSVWTIVHTGVEFDRVNGLEKVKDIWDTLQRAHEGTKPVKKAKRQLIEGQLDRFVMLDDEDPQEMYNRLKKLVNKVRAYGSRRWGD
jgi:hypothetical protein